MKLSIVLLMAIGFCITLMLYNVKTDPFGLKESVSMLSQSKPQEVYANSNNNIDIAIQATLTTQSKITPNTNHYSFNRVDYLGVNELVATNNLLISKMQQARERRSEL